MGLHDVGLREVGSLGWREPSQRLQACTHRWLLVWYALRRMVVVCLGQLSILGTLLKSMCSF